MILQILIGVTIGVIAGYFGGLIDKIIMRIVDIIMCFPFFVIAIALAADLFVEMYNKFSTHYRNVNVAGYYKNCSRRGSCNEAKRVYSGSESTWI